MDRKKVYYFCWAGETTFSGLAMECQIRESSGEKHLCYLDTDRGHMIKGKLICDDEDGFVFCSQGFKPGNWRFKVLTIENFCELVCEHVVGGRALAQTIHTTEELHEWYRKEFAI